MFFTFISVSNEAYFRDTSGTVSSIKGIRINVCDVGWRPPQTILARKMLADAVTLAQCERTNSVKIDGKTMVFGKI